VGGRVRRSGVQAGRQAGSPWRDVR
jgi:hypothetical protein